MIESDVLAGGSAQVLAATAGGRGWEWGRGIEVLAPCLVMRRSLGPESQDLVPRDHITLRVTDISCAVYFVAHYVITFRLVVAPLGI